MKLWADRARFEPQPHPPPPTAFFKLPNWRRFSTKYSQDATAVLEKQRRRTARARSANQSATANSTSARAPPYFLRELQC